MSRAKTTLDQANNLLKMEGMNAFKMTVLEERSEKRYKVHVHNVLTIIELNPSLIQILQIPYLITSVEQISVKTKIDSTIMLKDCVKTAHQTRDQMDLNALLVWRTTSNK